MDHSKLKFRSSSALKSSQILRSYFPKHSISQKRIKLNPPTSHIIPLTPRNRSLSPRKQTLQSSKLTNYTYTSPLTKTFSSNRQNSAQSPSKKPNRPNLKDSYITLKEAIRIKNWAVRAKPQLHRIWKKIINISNGISPIQSSQPYKYYVGKGNNPKLVKKCFMNRPQWVQTREISEANFVWTQWKDKKILQSLESASTVYREDQSLKQKIVCNIKVKTPNSTFKTVDISSAGFEKIYYSDSYYQLEMADICAQKAKMCNKLEFNQRLSNKKGLYLTMKKYYKAIGKDWLQFLPLTFNAKSTQDQQFLEFKKVFQEMEMKKQSRFKNIWILKPGQNSNRGKGIVVTSDLQQIEAILDQQQSQSKSFIIQKYIEKPLLIHKRKFDIRCYSLVTCINGVIQAYFYQDGYLRTSSVEYSRLNTANQFIHLTNDAVQKHSEDYGKFQYGNKLSYRDFQRYLSFHTSKKERKVSDLIQQIKIIVKDSIQASFLSLEPHRRTHTMEILGYDFMVDSNMKPWLIEVNTNPCLELSSPHLAVVIPHLVENAIRIAVDPLFPACDGSAPEAFFENKFELIFHEFAEGAKLVEKMSRAELGLEKVDEQDSEEERTV